MRILPIASDGWRFILPLAIVGVPLALMQAWLPKSIGIILVAAALFCAFFFRDFDRNTKLDDRLIYSPGDGKVMSVGIVGEHQVVRIFLSVLDGHVQRSPAKGTVELVNYQKGTFLDARHDRAHLDNERNLVVLKTPHGVLHVTQVAGLIARRIVCWVKEGTSLNQGERYGLIRFGSQVDVGMPKDVIVRVVPGDRVVSGETVIAEFAS
jgi:phosphatidylserine decarboxylase